MILRYDRIAMELPPPSGPDPAGAAAVQDANGRAWNGDSRPTGQAPPDRRRSAARAKTPNCDYGAARAGLALSGAKAEGSPQRPSAVPGSQHIDRLERGRRYTTTLSRPREEGLAERKRSAESGGMHASLGPP
jgi:hypothetical protein